MHKLRRFDGTSYRVWARQLQLYLEVKDLWDAIQLDMPTAEQLTQEGSNGGPLKTCASKQKLAMTIILASLNDEQAALVADVMHPRDMLNALKTTQRHICDATVGALKRKYMGLFLDSGGNMLDHIKQIRLVVAELGSYHVTFTDAELKSNFLQSIGPEWNGYVGSLEACSTCDEMMVKAASEARRRTEQRQRGRGGGATVTQTTSALTTHQPNRSGNSNSNGQNRGGNNNSNGQQAKRRKGKCWNCGKRGHMKQDCRSQPKNGGSGGSNAAEAGFCFQMSVDNMSQSGSLPKSHWIIDSGASSHMTGESTLLYDVRPLKQATVVTTASGTKLTAVEEGKARLPLEGGGWCTIDRVLLVPGLQRNLVSLNRVSSRGLSAAFSDMRCVISDGARKLVAQHDQNGLYLVEAPWGLSEAEALTTSVNHEDLTLWHMRMGHLNERDLKRVLTKTGIKVGSTRMPQCDICTMAKLARSPFKNKERRVMNDGQAMVAIAYVGPMPSKSHDGYTGFVSIMVEPFHLSMVMSVKNKDSQTQLEALRSAIAQLQLVQPRTRVVVVKSDNAQVYVGEPFAKFCNESMIVQEFSAPYAPQQNGKVERSNRVIVEMARSMLQTASMTHMFWSDAVVAAAYVRNRCLTVALDGLTPIEAVTGCPPVLTGMKVFGSYVHVLLPEGERNKLDSRTVRGRFIGYGKGGQSRFWVPSGAGACGRVMVSRDAVFSENISSVDTMSKDLEVLDLDDDTTVDRDSLSNGDISCVDEGDDALPMDLVLHSPYSVSEPVGARPVGARPDAQPGRSPVHQTPVGAGRVDDIATWREPRAEKVAVRRSSRERTKSARQLQFEESHSMEESGMIAEFLAMMVEAQDPLMLEEALARQDAGQWRQAASKEMNSLKALGTYEEVNLPPKAKLVKTKWVLRKKYHKDGSSTSTRRAWWRRASRNVLAKTMARRSVPWCVMTLYELC